MSEADLERVERTYTGKRAIAIAKMLRLYSHLPLENMKELCQQGEVLTPVLLQALESAVERCTSCKTLGRPLNVRKVSLNRLPRNFNEEVRIDFMWIMELTKEPKLHIRNCAMRLCVAVITPIRDMNVTTRIFKQHLVKVHGAPVRILVDQEFDGSDFGAMLKRHDIKSRPRSARRHRKIGSVESSNFTLCKLTARLLRDAVHKRNTIGKSFTLY